jgi:hypothetical protein
LHSKGSCPIVAYSFPRHVDPAMGLHVAIQIFCIFSTKFYQTLRNYYYVIKYIYIYIYARLNNLKYKKINSAWFGVYSAIIMKLIFFWATKTCSSQKFRFFRGKYSFSFHSRRVSQTRN